MQFTETVYNSYHTVRNDKNNTIQQPFDTLQYGTIRCDTVRYDVIRHDTVVRYERYGKITAFEIFAREIGTHYCHSLSYRV